MNKMIIGIDVATSIDQTVLIEMKNGQIVNIKNQIFDSVTVKDFLKLRFDTRKEFYALYDFLPDHDMNSIFNNAFYRVAVDYHSGPGSIGYMALSKTKKCDKDNSMNTDVDRLAFYLGNVSLTDPNFCSCFCIVFINYFIQFIIIIK